MRFNLYLLLIFIFSAGCSSKPKRVVLFDQILAQYVELIAKNEQLLTYGEGGSLMGGPNMDLIREFSIAARSKKLVDLKEARAITIRCVEQLLSLVNENGEIRPFLVHYPFPPTGADLTLVFLPFDESNFKSEKTYINTVYFMRGQVYYMQYDREKKDSHLTFKETYEEALERNVKEI